MSSLFNSSMFYYFLFDFDLAEHTRMPQDPGFRVPYTSPCRYSDKSFCLENDVGKRTSFSIRILMPNTLRRTEVGLCYQRMILRQEYVAS